MPTWPKPHHNKNYISFHRSKKIEQCFTTLFSINNNTILRLKMFALSTSSWFLKSSGLIHYAYKIKSSIWHIFFSCLTCLEYAWRLVSFLSPLKWVKDIHVRKPYKFRACVLLCPMQKQRRTCSLCKTNVGFLFVNYLLFQYLNFQRHDSALGLQLHTTWYSRENWRAFICGFLVFGATCFSWSNERELLSEFMFNEHTW